MALHKNGLRAGYTEYRYGGAKPVTLAGPQLKKERPLIKGAAREALVSRTIDVMSDWRKTPFEHEGAARAGLRTAMVIEGHGWRRSDKQAEEIVADALRLVGAVRPSWEEAQRAYVFASQYCHWCFVPIDEEDQTRARRFCSTSCAAVALERMARKTTMRYDLVMQSAQRLLRREKAPPQTCEYCARSFQSDRKARFCSLSCKSLNHAGDSVLLERDCDLCHATFKPSHRSQRCCSKLCAAQVTRRAVVEAFTGQRLECHECGNSFQPTTYNSKFCSSQCNSRAANREYRSRNRAPMPAMTSCAFCGDEYQPKIKLRPGASGYCSDRCKTDAYRFAKGAIPRTITRRVFDHFITLPADEFHRRRITPQKFDWLALEMGFRITGEVEPITTRALIDALFEAA